MGAGLDPVAEFVLRAGLFLLFAAAAWHKLRDLPRFVGALREYRLLPASLSSVTAWGVVTCEVAVAIGFLPRATVHLSAIGAAGLLSIYAAAIGWNLVRGRRRIDCGCLGPAGAQAISGGLVVRNAVLVALALALLAPAASRDLHWLDAATFVAALATAVLVFVASNELLALASRRALREVR